MPETLSASDVLDLAAGTALGQNRVLRVTSNAFAAEYIVEGDYLVLSARDREPEPGEVILIDFEGDGLAVGTYRREGRTHWIDSREPLIPPRSFCPPMIDGYEGVVVAVVRSCRPSPLGRHLNVVG